MRKYCIIVLAFFVFSCQNDQQLTPVAKSSNKSKINPTILPILNKMVDKGLISSENLNAALNRSVSKGARLKAGLGLKIDFMKKSKLSYSIDYQYFTELRRRVIDGTLYECGPTKVDDFFNDNVNAMTDDEFFAWIFSSYVFDMAYLYNNTQVSKPSFGANGEFTPENNRTIKDLYSFWNTPILPVFDAIHGDTFKNEAKVAAFFDTGIPILYGEDPFNATDAMDIALWLKEVLGGSFFQQYSHPILTFNAFQASAVPELGIVGKILMGDGLIKYYADLGFKDVSTQVVLAHEFGHYIQEIYGYFDGNEYILPESTVRLELMADAFSGYYNTHSRGASLNKIRVAYMQDALYQIGDCQFLNPAHHGTPNQRKRASEFGFSLADSNKKQGKILSVTEFKTAFDGVYNSLIAPDAL